MAVFFYHEQKVNILKEIILHCEIQMGTLGLLSRSGWHPETNEPCISCKQNILDKLKNGNKFRTKVPQKPHCAQIVRFTQKRMQLNKSLSKRKSTEQRLARVNNFTSIDP